MSAAPVSVSDEENYQLRRISKSPEHPMQTRTRARVILASAKGLSGATIAAVLGISRRTVSQVRERWRRSRLDGVVEGQRSGRPKKSDNSSTGDRNDR